MARKLSTSRGSTGFPRWDVWAERISGRAAANAKLTRIAPPVRMKSRRFIAASLCLCRAKNRGKNSCVGCAPAEIPSKPLFDLFGRRMRRLAEKGLCRHDHSIRAVPALRGLLGNERGLHRIGFLGRTESFDRRDGVSLRLFDWSDAGARCFAVDQHGARSALAETASEFCAVQSERVTKDIKQRLRGIPRINGGRAAIHAKFEGRHETSFD